MRERERKKENREGKSIFQTASSLIKTLICSPYCQEVCVIEGMRWKVERPNHYLPSIFVFFAFIFHAAINEKRATVCLEEYKKKVGSNLEKKKIEG